MQKKVLIGLFIVSGLFLGLSVVANDIKLNSIKPQAKSAAPLTDEQQGILAVRKAKASVVNILGENKAQKYGANPNNDQLTLNVPPTQVLGTGFVLEADGLILTNYHVVEDNTLEYSVTLSDGTSYPAKVLGTD